jgi:hypothetical protein
VCMYIYVYMNLCMYEFVCMYVCMYEGRSENKERFAIQRYLLIIGKKQNMQVLSHTSPTSPHSHLGH